ncbi:hypothetical protein ACFWOJ_07710 [Streptomyces sp. NPDC058439]|uniref:hypothetical protein n=1 Tax=Streptomyces sp. NPDC058439 TaxID=3346500 RepID=UPI0036498AF0
MHFQIATGTIRHHLINIPARTATGARRFTLHLPHLWRRSTTSPTCGQRPATA